MECSVLFNTDYLNSFISILDILEMVCFGTRFPNIKDCGVLIEELIVWRDNSCARIHAL